MKATFCDCCGRIIRGAYWPTVRVQVGDERLEIADDVCRGCAEVVASELEKSYREIQSKLRVAELNVEEAP